MKRFLPLLSPVPLLIVAGLTAAAVAVRPADDFGSKSFTRLKALAGDWVAVKDGAPTDEVVSRMSVTAGGHAVLEILFPGTPKEMVTVYYLDAGALTLQHYCVLGNQPRMVARAGRDGDELAWDFAGCCNLADDGAAHMREATMRFVGADRLPTEWRQFEKGKNDYTVAFDLARKSRE